MHRFARSVSLVALALAAAACEEDSSSAPGGGPTPDTQTPGTPRPTCKPPTAGPTVHDGGQLENDEVWTADTSPHIVKRTVSVRMGRKLTIEPCAEVLLAKDQSLNVAWPNTPNSGLLVAEGTETTPIRIHGEDGARWGNIMIRQGGSARLAHVTLEDGGAGEIDHGATIAVYGDGEDGADEMLAVKHVTIAKSAGVGAFLTRGAAFARGSTDLVVEASGNDADPYPLHIEEHAFDTLPTGKYTGNRRDEIIVHPAGGRFAGTGLLADGTLRNRGIPYRIGTTVGHSLRIGGRPDGKLVTLTIEAGVVMKFEKGSSLRVQYAQTQEPSTAAIRALGTAANPVVMTSAAAAPAPGDWMGLWFGGVPSDANLIDNVQIAYAGGACGCILNTCSQIERHEGAVIFTAPPKQAFITHTKFVSSAGHGITQGFDGTFIDFKETNEFVSLAGCKQTKPRESTSVCPTPRPACDGSDDE